MNRPLARALAALAVLAAATIYPVRAEPYLAVAQGFKCGLCHVNPTGGGMRTAFGVSFAEQLLPAHPLPEGLPVWTGGIGDFLRLGGDLRAGWSRTSVPHQPTQQGWATDSFRLYGDVAVIPGRLGIVLDETLAPGTAHTQEVYARYTDPNAGWYAKAGQFYLPFGWRLQDPSAFVREVSGIGMTTPDNGVEFGIERDAWSAHVALTNGSANAGTGSGHQLTGQFVWVEPTWRIGASAAATNSSAGNRYVFGVHGGLRTGPLVWLGEVDEVRDDGFPEGRRTLLAGLGEVDWSFLRGHNLKFTAEAYDPDRSVANDRQTRFSLVYEYTPIPFLQLRAGLRRYSGIPQNDLQNRQAIFLEVHGFL